MIFYSDINGVLGELGCDTTVQNDASSSIREQSLKTDLLRNDNEKLPFPLSHALGITETYGIMQHLFESIKCNNLN